MTSLQRPPGRAERTPGSRQGARRRSRTRASTQFDWKMLAILMVFGAFGAVLWGARNERPTLSGLIGVPLILALGLPLIGFVGRSEKRFDLTGLMAFSLILRMALAVPRMVTAVDGYAYHAAGQELAESFRHFDFVVDTGQKVPGTGSVRYVSGLVHVLAFDDFFTSLLIFTLLAFWGTWFFYKAFTIAVPTGDHYRYARLVFLWPSLLFWTSSIGKEAVMTVTVGLTLLGFALAVTGNWWGLAAGAGGLIGTVMVRPHMALVIIIAVVASILVPRSTGGSSLSTGARVTIIILLLVGGSMVARSTAEFLKLENLSSSSVDTAFNTTEEQTTQGGSNFKAARVRSPVDYPFAVVTVVMRPFPFEAKSSVALLSSIEGLAILGLFVVSARRLVSLPRLMMRYSYLSFSVAYVVLFCFVFSVIGNFGILARQRTLLLPILFVLLALPPIAPMERGGVRGRLWRRGIPDRPRRTVQA